MFVLIIIIREKLLNIKLFYKSLSNIKQKIICKSANSGTTAEYKRPMRQTKSVSMIQGVRIFAHNPTKRCV